MLAGIIRILFKYNSTAIQVFAGDLAAPQSIYATYSSDDTGGASHEHGNSQGAVCSGCPYGGGADARGSGHGTCRQRGRPALYPGFRDGAGADRLGRVLRLQSWRM